MSSSTPLGDFLRARREGLKPHDVGLPEYGHRRVKGLRREEVAMLAGMSGDYYVRLEQGRESSPSPQVVEAVARALLLEEEAADHLRRLARPPRPRSGRPAREQAGPQLLQVMDGFAHAPAFVLGPALDILAGNAMAQVLHEAFSPADNLARMVFCDPAGREFYPEWERAAHSCVAELRAAYGHDPNSTRITEVAADLSARSPEFADLWRRHEVRSKTQELKHLRHAHVGDLHIRFTALTVNGTPHQQLVIYQAEPDGPTAAAFQRLAERAGTPGRAATG